MRMLDVPISREFSPRQIDLITSFGFLGIAFVTQRESWPDFGRTRDDDGAFFAMFNVPLSKWASERQTIELVMKNNVLPPGWGRRGHREVKR
jgi:hypothetical protein